MICHRSMKLNFLALAAVFTVALMVAPASLQAQTIPELKLQAKALYDASRFPEALPILEKIVQAEPNDGESQYYLAFSLIGTATSTQDPAARRALRVRGRNAFIKTAELGIGSDSLMILVKAMAGSLPADGSDPVGFSDIKEANDLMNKGEAAFSSGKMDDALKAYQAALKIDPRLYHAALFAGDVFMHTEKWDDAEVWYRKAITIDPFTETAYRYSATPLMKQKKYDLARDRYVEAFIVAPYNRLALSGLVQWGETTKTALAHPQIDVPKITVDAAGKSNSSVNINPLAVDGSMAWMSYVATRQEWRDSFAAKNARQPYRHTLAEEAEALRSVIRAAKALKPKTLDPQIQTLAQLDQDGVLEAFVLMAIPDQGIALDHAAYLRQNRDKLRLYVTKYVIGGGR